MKATEALSQLIGSCVSGTETCRSQHFSSCFSCRPLLLPSLSPSLADTDTAGPTVVTRAGCLYQGLNAATVLQIETAARKRNRNPTCHYTSVC